MARPSKREVEAAARAWAGLPPLAQVARPRPRRVIKPSSPALMKAATRAISDKYSFRPAEGGRQTQPMNYNPFGLSGWYFIPKRQYQEIDVTELDVTQFTADQLLAILPDLNPDFSVAVWSYLRTCGTDLKFTAVSPDGKEMPEGQKHLDDLILGTNPQFGGMEALIRQLLLSAYLQGAVCAEAAPTQNLKDLDDIYAVNPDSIWFQRDEEQKLVPFQRQAIWGNLAAAYPYRMMNEETFFYNPVDPFIDDPYGRAPAAAALQVVFGLVQILRDLQRVVHMIGFPRADISLNYELLEPMMPAEVLEDEGAKYAWMTARMDELVGAYNSMAPEDAFVHWDFVSADHHKEMGQGGRGSGGRALEPQAIVSIFRDQLIVALKTLPIFHGGGQGKGETETYGTVEYEIYGASCVTLREIAAEVLARGLTVALQFRGVGCEVQHEWAPIRTTQRLQDAMAEAQEVENAANKRDQGWVTQDDASNDVTGSDAVAPAPAAAPAPQGPPKPAPQPMPPGTTPPPGKAAAGEPGRKRLAETIVRSGPGMGLVYAHHAATREVERMLGRYGR